METHKNFSSVCIHSNECHYVFVTLLSLPTLSMLRGWDCWINFPHYAYEYSTKNLPTTSEGYNIETLSFLFNLLWKKLEKGNFPFDSFKLKENRFDWKSSRVSRREKKNYFLKNKFRGIAKWGKTQMFTVLKALLLSIKIFHDGSNETWRISTFRLNQFHNRKKKMRANETEITKHNSSHWNEHSPYLQKEFCKYPTTTSSMISLKLGIKFSKLVNWICCLPWNCSLWLNFIWVCSQNPENFSRTSRDFFMFSALLSMNS